MPGDGPWYYTITALDNKSQFTNECWYAKVTNAIVNTTTIFSIVKSVSNVRLNTVPVVTIPGATITYKIIYSNKGSFNGKYVIIYDKIPSQVTFFTEVYGTASGWTFEMSTNSTPSQNWDSIDYSTIYPADRSKVKWIRWKKVLLVQVVVAIWLIR